MFNYAEYYNENKIHECLFYKEEKELEPLDVIKGVLLDYYAPSVCNKMVRRQLLVEKDICFLPSVKMGEDLLFSITLLSVSERVMQADKTCYYYFMRDTSATHKVSDGVLTIKESIKCIEEVLSNYHSECLFKEEIDYLKFKHFIFI